MKIFFKVLKWIGLFIGFIVVLLIVGIIVFSVPGKLPKPTGKYEVGVTYRTVETSRTADFKELIDSNRTVYLKIWYPAVAENQVKKIKTPFIEGGMKTGKQFFDKPQLWQDIAIRKAVTMKTNSFIDLPIADGKFPVVTYSHGYSQWSSDNTTLMESMASKGFIVVSISHLHQALFAPVSKDSAIVTKVISLGNDDTDPEEFKRHRERYDSIQTQEELNAYHMYGRKFSNGRSADIWSDDILSAINYMKQTQENSSDFFFGRVDITKIGSVGFSMGGSAALNATLNDSTILAAINIDGGLAGDFLEKRPDADILMLTGLRRLPASDLMISHFGNFRDKNDEHYPTLMIENARHANFTDIQHLSVLLKWLGVMGTVDVDFATEHKNLIVYDFLNASFNQAEFDADKYKVENKIVNFDYN